MSNKDMNKSQSVEAKVATTVAAPHTVASKITTSTAKVAGGKIKGAPLTRDEVTVLIDLVEGHKILTNRATDAKNNQLKEAAWCRITEEFNASVSSYPRRTDQLRLKWENLKKNSRRRLSQIKQNQNESVDGKPDYIPPDRILDRVAAILDKAYEAQNVTCGGDSEPINNEESCWNGGDVDSSTNDPSCDPLSDDQEIPTETQPKFLFGNTKEQRRLLEEDTRVRILRNRAIADYYTTKKKKIELEIEHMELLNRQLKLELD